MPGAQPSAPPTATQPAAPAAWRRVPVRRLREKEATAPLLAAAAYREDPSGLMATAPEPTNGATPRSPRAAPQRRAWCERSETQPNGPGSWRSAPVWTPLGDGDGVGAASAAVGMASVAAVVSRATARRMRRGPVGIVPGPYRGLLTPCRRSAS